LLKSSRELGTVGDRSIAGLDVPTNRGAAAVLKAFPWDVGAAMAMSVVGVLIAMFFERSPVLALF
jgi:hypothetical protein